jgi:hypothetical protein
MKIGLTVEERIALVVTLALLAGLVVFGFSVASSQGAEVPPVPKSVVPPLRVWYFAATATDGDGAESDFSKELVWTNLSRARGVTLAWDPPVSPGITNYRVYSGGKSATYTNSVSSGTNLTCEVRLAPALKTNRVVHVSSVNATSMWTSATLKGPWIQIAATNVSLTNPAPSQLWRVEQPAKVVITKEML